MTAWTRPLLKVADLGALVIGLWVMVTITPEFNSRSTILVALVAVGVFSIAAEVIGVYRDWQGQTIEKELGCVLLAWMSTHGLLFFLGQFTHYTTEISSPSFFLWALWATLLSMIGRIMFRHLVVWINANGIRTRGYAVIGATDLGVQLVRNIQAQPDMGLTFLGFYDDRPESRSISLPDDMARRLGGLDKLISRAKLGEVPVIFITLPMRAEGRIQQVVQELSDTTASVYLVPDFFVFQLLHSRWTDVGGIPAVSIYENPFYGVDGVVKRIFDIALAMIALVVAAVPMLIIAALIKLTSPGPVFFRQKRYGLDGKEILVWKFRSMVTMDNGRQVQQAQKNDPRVTRIGAILRRTSLDELPQLFNVLNGTMSMVGPRPHASAHNEFYRQQIDGYMLRHKVKPGITGMAQVNGCRGETEQIEKMERRIHFDHRYIREWSIWLDVKILFKTFKVVFSRENAY